MVSYFLCNEHHFLSFLLSQSIFIVDFDFGSTFTIFSNGSIISPGFKFTELHAFTLAARSYALLFLLSRSIFIVYFDFGSPLLNHIKNGQNPATSAVLSKFTFVIFLCILLRHFCRLGYFCILLYTNE